MYEITIEQTFAAAHSIRIRGEQEPVHGHNWHVTVVVASDTLDEDGLVCDFHDLEKQLDNIISPFHNRALNDVPPFDTVNPTAELVARHIGDEIVAWAPSPVRLVSVTVTEAPNCAATWRPDAGEVTSR